MNKLKKNENIIYDWNTIEKRRPLTFKRILLYDETLRDGIQSPSVKDPPIEKKKKLLHLMNDLGIHYADIGLPGAGPRAYNDVLELTREIVNLKLNIKPSCACRTLASDIQPVIEISQKVGTAIEVMAFIGSSPIRQYAEGWDLNHILRLSKEAIEMAVSANLPCTYVTEDTTRSQPEVLDALFRNAIECGAKRLCLCDTVGHATPAGVRNLIRFTKSLIAGIGEDIGIDWHGHNDRGISLGNSIWAIEAGADRIHACALGIGERVGNVPMELLLLNLKLLDELKDHDLSKLVSYCEFAAEAVSWNIAPNYPLLGRDAFRTATGVHAAAIIKAEKKGDTYLADRIYSAVPAQLFGKSQQIEIGPLSGESNVIYWLERQGYAVDSRLVKRIFDQAKASDRVLKDSEIIKIIETYQKEKEEK